MQAFDIRRLEPDDSLDELTSMLHRAFSRLGGMGLNCTCVDQSVETTAKRVRLGHCLVAQSQGRIVGTVTLHRPERLSRCDWYRRSELASLHQLAVDPCCQGSGCGTALLTAAEDWARERNFGELALDTPAKATHLLAFYRAQGFRVVGQVQWPGKAYCSSVLSKDLQAGAVPVVRQTMVPPHRHAAWCGVMAQR